MNLIYKLSIAFFLFPIIISGQYDLSVSTGSLWIDGDVDRLCGLGSINQVGAEIDYQIKNNFYLSAGLNYGNAKGLEQYQVWSHVTAGGGLHEDIYNDYKDDFYAPYHSTNLLSSSFGITHKIYFNNDAIMLKSNINVGLSYARTYMNLYDDQDNIYKLQVGSIRSTEPLFPPEIFDDSFESRMNEIGTFFHYGGSLGLGINIINNGYIVIGYSIQATSTDYLDGIAFRTAIDDTNNTDMIHRATFSYTHRFGTFQW